ncbi:Ash2-trithorax family protein [Bimuria novae-zelandiae CBS 107.79]|uniref:Ash2-trithorax family protein n=1 Tax=Bimuria novae-zelandiae CBS 107.79 TaxID=1447943 RepID=A0A6A5UT90_9PLEO|nr:Ash2-trithorax family protein [Bimuria novae-zelandiae CBS 107.79]
MAESNSTSTSRANTPGASLPLKRTLDEDHAPAISSPLNPNPDATSRARPRPPPREQREKRETIKKREASSNTRGSTPNPSSRTKKDKPLADSPMRYSIPEPKLSDYQPPKEGLFAWDPPLTAPDGTQLWRPIDHAWNKKGYRYTHAVADPQFRHKQYYRQTDSKPHQARMSHEDSDRHFSFDKDTATIVTQEKGWRMGRGNVVAREGRMYFEVRALKGIPAEGPMDPTDPKTGEIKSGSHIRVGWSRREAPLDAPVGFDGYSYGLTDSRFEVMHRSRPSKVFKPLPKNAKSRSLKERPGHSRPMPVEYVNDEHFGEGDIIGLEIQLPSLSLHRKVVDGIYNPAVDIGDGFDVKDANDPTEKPIDIIRDRIPVSYKGTYLFEQLDYHVTKPVDQYQDRAPVQKIVPTPNHEEVCLRTLPHSHIKVYKNGKEMGIAYEGLLAFLPPASQPSPEALKAGARPGFDDGMVGYFPTVAIFGKAVAQVNFGPDFWCPPEAMQQQRETDVKMEGSDTIENSIPEGRNLRAIGDRYKEQIAEDIVWDIIDEVDFFVQDGGWNYTGETPQDVAGKATPKARGFVNPDDNVGEEVFRRY